VELEQATTTSLEALKVYSLGVKARNEKGAPASVPFFRRAVELDPQFAMAYGRLATAYDMAGEVDLKTENIREAFSLRDRVSARERLYLETHYYHSLTGELEKAEQAYEMCEKAPHRETDGSSNTRLAGRHN
jgi:eukaryotic-like serine/threonine-protein kinase